MVKTIEVIILATGLLCSSVGYGVDTSEGHTSKYATVLEKECSRVRFENNAVICEDTYCKKKEQVDCGRKYCIEEGYSQRWQFIPQELQNVQLIHRENDLRFPYGVSYQPKSKETKLLLFRSEEAARGLMAGGKK